MQRILSCSQFLKTKVTRTTYFFLNPLFKKLIESTSYNHIKSFLKREKAFRTDCSNTAATFILASSLSQDGLVYFAHHTYYFVLCIFRLHPKCPLLFLSNLQSCYFVCICACRMWFRRHVSQSIDTEERIKSPHVTTFYTDTSYRTHFLLLHFKEGKNTTKLD